MSAAPNPNPKRGVFETLLVVGGHPIELDAHLARLAASLRALFGAELSDKARELILAEASGLGLGRVRLTATPVPAGAISLDVRGAAVESSTVFPPATRAVALRSLVVPAGQGAHKWADRALLARAEEVVPEGSVPLLVAADGCVLETSRANVYAAHDGVLTTPPADGRILPGVTRELVGQLARTAGIDVREAPLESHRLLEADEVFLTGAVLGIEPVGSIDGAELQPVGSIDGAELQPVGSIDGAELQPVGEITPLLAGELRRRWMGPG